MAHRLTSLTLAILATLAFALAGPIACSSESNDAGGAGNGDETSNNSGSDDQGMSTSQSTGGTTNTNANTSGNAPFKLASLPEDTAEMTVEGPGAILATERENGQPVVVEGFVQQIGTGYYNIRLADPDNIQYCGQGSNTDDGCPTPWDYCCADRDAVAVNIVPVRFVNESGEMDEINEPFGFTHLERIRIVGTYVIENGNARIHATGYQTIAESPVKNN